MFIYTNNNIGNGIHMNQLNGEPLRKIVGLFQALGDPTRFRIITSLIESEINVGDIAQIAGISASAASHQLRILRNLRLVKSRRQGREIYYTLDDDHVSELVKGAIRHVLHE